MGARPGHLNVERNLHKTLRRNRSVGYIMRLQGMPAGPCRGHFLFALVADPQKRTYAAGHNLPRARLDNPADMTLLGLMKRKT